MGRDPSIGEGVGTDTLCGGPLTTGGKVKSPDGEGNDDASTGARVTGTETLGVVSIDELTVGAVVASDMGAAVTPATGLALGR